MALLSLPQLVWCAWFLFLASVRAEYRPLDLHDFTDNLGAQSPEPESEILTHDSVFLDITCGLGQTDASSGFTGDVEFQATTRGKSPTRHLRLPFRQVESPRPASNSVSFAVRLPGTC